MATDKYEKLAAKLRELFQLDQPDLDFGIYRVMHLKRDAVERYLDPKAPDGLRAAVESVFSSASAQSANEALEKARTKVVEAFGADAIGADGVLASDYVSLPYGKAYVEAQAAALAAQDSADGEKDVFDLLHDFFSRYYQGGDFVSLRRHSPETNAQAKPYAIPYEGEEVKLHWANADQYYIKTSENFSSYSFDLAESKEIKTLGDLWKTANGIPSGPLRVHFRIAAADEGEHNNAKPNEKRYFFLDEDRPFEIADGDLSVFFRHETDPNKPDKAKNWQKQLLAKAETTVLDALAESDDDLGRAFRTALAFELPTEKGKTPEKKTSEEKEKTRTVFARYLAQYAARNTEDYFIHKDLGAFLRRELEFYVKNEILNASDLARQDDDGSLLAVSEAQLRRARAFYRVARRIVDDFLAPLEDFQKKLWLKKKFVVQCDWCMTLDIVEQYAPELLPEIFANEKQKEEWRDLGLPDGVLAAKGGASSPSEPTAEQGELSLCASASLRETKIIDARMVDTRFFPESFKAKLLDAIPNLDGRTDGVLVHSENFQALRLMEERYRGQIKCIYIDPPYNTGDGDFPYKDAFRHSSWASMMEDRLRVSKSLLPPDGMLGCHMDEHEHELLDWIFGRVYGDGNLGPLVWDKRNPKGDVAGIAAQHEYVHFAAKDKTVFSRTEDAFIRDKPNAPAMLKKAEQLIRRADGVTEKVREEFAEWVKKSDFSKGEKAYQYIDDNGDVYRLVSMAWPNKKKAPDEYFIPLIHPVTGEKCPVPERGWRNPPETMTSLMKKGLIIFGPDEKTQPQRKYLLKENLTEMVPSLYYMGGSDDAMFKEMDIHFENPKPVQASMYFLQSMARPKDSVIIDFFAGSGTAGHAVINLNRQDLAKGVDAKRKYILVDMGEHFWKVLKRRIEKVVYSPDWKEGKPVSADKGISHCFKYLTLESYEDTLNNLSFDKEPKGAEIVSDYLLRYMLEAGTKGSPSLLDAAAFAHPFSCKLEVKKTGSEERETPTVDLVETFNWLIGLRVRKVSEIKRFSAEFERMPDPDLPAEAQATRLRVKDKIQPNDEGPFAFQTVEGTVPRDRAKTDGAMDEVIVVWRELTGDSERDNAVLDKFLDSKRISSRDFEYDLLYINGSNNVPCLRREDQSWKVQLIEETFLKRMLEDGEA